MNRFTSFVCVLLGLFAFGASAVADPIPAGDSISTTIYGDARDGNPGDLAVNVEITFSYDVATESWIAHWTVSIAPETLADYAGSDLRIQAFGFNLDIEGTPTITNLSPNIYDADVGGGTVPGTGGTNVEFLICNDTGPLDPFSCTGTASNSFSFDLILADGGQFDTDMFDNASIFQGDYIYDPGDGQMAAHIIGFEGGCSGAVGGLYGENEPGEGFDDGVGECESVSVPEPGTLSLLGIGLLGLALGRRRRKIA